MTDNINLLHNYFFLKTPVHVKMYNSETPLSPLSLSLSLSIYIYIYKYMCVCVCVCVSEQ